MQIEIKGQFLAKIINSQHEIQSRYNDENVVRWWRLELQHCPATNWQKQRAHQSNDSKEDAGRSQIIEDSLSRKDNIAVNSINRAQCTINREIEPSK